MDAGEILRLWLDRAAALLSLGLALVLSLAPVSLQAGGLGLPGLFAALAAAWIARRPDALPLPLLVLASLAADLLQGAPLGLGTLGLLALREILGPEREAGPRLSFFREWAIVALCLAGTLLGTCLALWLTFAPLPGAADAAWHCLGTVLAYPLAAALVSGLFLRRRRADGERGFA